MRQDEPLLIRAVNELETGHVTPEIVQFLKELERPLSVDDSRDTVYLYGTNFEVDWHNSTQMQKLEGDQIIYRAVDSGTPGQLRRILAPKVLILKKHCPVIILKNISEKLVNGSRGTVVDFDDSGPVIAFPHATVTLQKSLFSVYNPQEGRTVAERTQYPVKPAFALTIHKSQGLTIPRLVVNCRQIYQPGQVGVAVGRAVSSSGLQVFRKIKLITVFCQIRCNLYRKIYFSQKK